MKLFLDDVRDPYNDSWTLVRSFQEAVEVFDKHYRSISHISFDHDLGHIPFNKEQRELTGYTFAHYVLGKYHHDPDINLGDLVVYVHSANIVGAMNIIHLFDHKVKDLKLMNNAFGVSVITSQL